MEKYLRNCELLGTSTFNENEFEVQCNNLLYDCKCANPDRDWDKLYDYMGSKRMDLKIVKEVNGYYFVIIL